MTDSLLDKPIVLILNRLWIPIAWKTPKEAIKSLCCENGQDACNFVLDVITEPETGTIVDAVRYTWDEWIELPVEPRHLPILTKSRPVRCPTVVISGAYEENPVKAVSFSSEAIRRRDGDTCQVSGKKLKPGEGNLGHIKARAKGGKKTFDNIVWMDRALNSLQGTRTPEEMGWTLAKKPAAPKAVPASFKITDPKLPEHKPLVIQ